MAGDKLNPLKTKHDIEMQIDDIFFKVTFKPVNKHIQEKLNRTRELNKEQYETIDAKRFELKEFKDFKSVNDEILSTFGTDGGIDSKEKTAILLENKDYIKKISSLEKEIRELDKDLEDVNILIEDYYKQMFEECIFGEDKVKFQKAIDDAGLSYSLVNIHINESVRAAQEKK